MNAFFFALTSISCLIGVITGIVRMRTSYTRALHLFAIIILAFLSMIYALAYLSITEVISFIPMIRNGIFTSVGVLFLSNLFTIMFIVGSKRHGC